MTQRFVYELLWFSQQILLSGSQFGGWQLLVATAPCHSSLWMIVPAIVWACIMGKRVAASHCWTTSMYPRAGDLEVSISPNTHTSFVAALPWWFYSKKTKECM